MAISLFSMRLYLPPIIVLINARVARVPDKMHCVPIFPRVDLFTEKIKRVYLVEVTKRTISIEY